MQLHSSTFAHQKTGATMNPILIIGLFVLSLALIDVLAVRHGADSRTLGDEQKNWW
jgi:hypothetical protein